MLITKLHKYIEVQWKRHSAVRIFIVVGPYLQSSNRTNFSSAAAHFLQHPIAWRLAVEYWIV